MLERSIHFRPDWEKVVSAVIDWAVGRNDVDASQIVLMGESRGGYLAARAAAHDARIALCVLDPALRRGMLTHGMATAWDYFVDAARYEQEDIIGKIACPTLVCDAESDDISAFSRTFFGLLRCEKDYLRFTADEGAGEHCVSGNRALFHERVFDWLDQHIAQSRRAMVTRT